MRGMMISAFRTLPASMAFFLCIAAPALAEGDAVHGEKVFSRCSTCHSIDAAHPHGTASDGRGGQADSLRS